MTAAGRLVINTARRLSLVRPARFVLSSGLATASHWLVFMFIVNAGTEPRIATAVGAFIGAVVNYIMQYRVTFRCNASSRSILPRYILVCTLTWIANLLLFSILHDGALLPPMHAQGMTTLAVAFMSYSLYRGLVFSDRKSQPLH